MKKIIKRNEKFELHNNVKIKILEKKPAKGGTPAADKKEIKIILVKI
jgi:hypothetical protein